MCGRYANHIQDMHDWSDILTDWPITGDMGFNVAPSQLIPVVTANGGRRLRWGLIPPWHKGGAMKFATFNARLEGIESKPSFRHAWSASQRCLIPALGYYEWRKEGGIKQPYFISALDSSPIVFAGLWEEGVDGFPQGSCSIITHPASGELESLHPRMPCILTPDTAESWMYGKPAEMEPLLNQDQTGGLQYYAVSTNVNSTKSQGESLIEPVQTGGLFSL